MGRRVRVLGRVGAAVLVVAAAAAPAVGSWLLPPTAPAPAAAHEVTVPPGPVTLVCPPPPRLSSTDVASDPAFDPTPQAAATSVTLFALGRAAGAPAGSAAWAALEADPGTGEPLAEAGAPSSSLVAVDVPGASRLTGEPADGAPALLGGALVSRVDAGDLRSLAAGRCAPATGSAWLVAGTTELGASARLVLANPGATPATVRLRLWGATGPVETGQAGTLLVPGRSERAVLLESIAPDEPRLAVRVTATGGSVAAFLQDSRLAGFVPGGVDLAEPGAEPGLVVTVPGLDLLATNPDDPDAGVVRVVNPGEDDATVRFRLLGESGPVAVPGAEERVVDAGTVADVSLAGVPAGRYTAELVSDRPVTAAAMLTRAGEAGPDAPDRPPVDRAWFAAAEAARSVLLTLPAADAEAVVLLANPSDEPLDVRVRGAAGDGGDVEPIALTIAPRSTATLDAAVLVGRRGLVVDVPDADAVGLVAAVVLSASAPDGPLIAGLGGQVDAAQEGVVLVRLR